MAGYRVVDEAAVGVRSTRELKCHGLIGRRGRRTSVEYRMSLLCGGADVKNARRNVSGGDGIGKKEKKKKTNEKKRR